MKHQVVSESGLPASSVVRAVLQYTNCGSRKVDLRARLPHSDFPIQHTRPARLL